MNKNQSYKRIYVDTNVLINYCNGIKDDCDTLDYIFTKRDNKLLFTSSLAITQTITRLQTSTSKRKAYISKDVVEMIEALLKKFTIISLTREDIENSMNKQCKDLEDNIHYTLSRKLKCDCILTNNKKDFSQFNIPVFEPILRLAKLKIK